MKALVQEKEQAIALRKKGYSYKDIMEEISVSKSSLSLWLKNLPLTVEEKQYLKTRADANISRGRIKAASAHSRNRRVRERELYKAAQKEFEMHQADTLFHVGIALYWAEGAKRNATFHFMNSDVEMIEVLLRWLESFTTYSRLDIGYRLYLHEPFQHDNWERWWQNKLGVRATQFKKTIIKPSHLQIKKRPDYKGCLRVEVPRSTELLTKMKFWTNMLVVYYKKR